MPVSEVFTKTRAGAPPLFFDREALGLRTLAEAGARVPAVREVGEEGITLDRVSSGGQRTAASEEAFGRELAALHRTTGERYGAIDGEPTAYLGDCPVDLTPCETFAESWLDRRVLPLTRRCVERGQLDASSLADAERLTPEHLGPLEPPTLVHGDLWAGNRLVDPRGRSWLIDPCAHYAHREVDLAMMQLFGGFSGRVFAAYAEDFPLADGWESRVPAYQSVPLLVHVLLFGGGYAVQAAEALRSATC
ncbi:Ribulosamine/erythrulosamine 3-kinase potentially involved in protein deglycation [Serinicoccus hydrothermalis]|uniref:Ribulosamine/erythrulosamine 3-kinase potentially involved in protein deglycation n=1 Tax=Serinicoccus hydrothermalis TaxID=1758689 RepID=A0A1B1NFP7_9MICO|nr:fructosamine kinase family protein [Serinicoccus hydrothermalis]ANS80205.1 Ribulosamine/erythrulosamine 3-kinase potentially involved in protein deglycation [Serinicoccus hydrothermalis]